MKRKNELGYKDLKLTCDPKVFNFTTTDELEPINTGIGQERGIRALEFGLSVDINGYNVYVEGPYGDGKTAYVKNYLNKIAKKKKPPNDWCYLYNFNNPNEPVAVSLPAGQGKEFRDAMNSFINDIKVDIKNTFNNQDFEKEKNLIKQEYEIKRNILMEELNKKSAEYGFTVKSSQNGIYMMPIVNGKTIAEDEFNKLDESIKKEYEDKSTIVQQHIMEAIGQIKSIEKASDKHIQEWQSNIALITINAHINLIKSKYKKNSKINVFLDSVKKDILKNINLFTADEKTLDSKLQGPQAAHPEVFKPWLNYRVNLFIDNSNIEGAPSVADTNYSYHNIFGKLEYENYYGTLKTDYTMLKPGLLHIANGGYLVFQANDLLTNSLCYDSLKKVLRSKTLGIENAADPRSSMVMVSLKPEPIPLDLKVILIGDENIYQTLLAMDPDFRKLFKIKVEFADDAPMNKDNAVKLARFVKGYCDHEHLPALDSKAMAKIVEYASKLADNQDKLSTRFTDLSIVVGEASTWAKLAKSKVITEEFITKALIEKVDRVKKYDERYMEMIKDDTLLISTSGNEIGQINGLTIMNVGDYTFGKPVKITANTYTGKNGIINIEREVELSGSSHSKGILILSGYLGEMFAQDMPLSLYLGICFDQL